LRKSTALFHHPTVSTDLSVRFLPLSSPARSPSILSLPIPRYLTPIPTPDLSVRQTEEHSSSPGGSQVSSRYNVKQFCCRRSTASPIRLIPQTRQLHSASSPAGLSCRPSCRRPSNDLSTRGPSAPVNANITHPPLGPRASLSEAPPPPFKQPGFTTRPSPPTWSQMAKSPHNRQP
jgi:hypothetical protein